jgi:hypothetical protein
LVVPWSSKPVKRVRFPHSAPKLGPLIANGKQPALQAGNRGSIPRRSTKFGALVEKYSGCDESVRRFVSCFRDRRRVVRAAGCDPAHESSMSPQGRARSSTGKSAAVLTRRPRVRVSPRAPEGKGGSYAAQVFSLQDHDGQRPVGEGIETDTPKRSCSTGFALRAQIDFAVEPV